MTSVLVVNAGSSSLKLRVLSPDDAVTTALDLSPWDGSPDDPALRRFLGGAGGAGGGKQGGGPPGRVASAWWGTGSCTAASGSPRRCSSTTVCWPRSAT